MKQILRFEVEVEVEVFDDHFEFEKADRTFWKEMKNAIASDIKDHELEADWPCGSYGWTYKKAKFLNRTKVD